MEYSAEFFIWSVGRLIRLTFGEKRFGLKYVSIIVLLNDNINSIEQALGGSEIELSKLGIHIASSILLL